ncbi:MAG: hypothetical protein U0807_06910 [Candidatus Binatia bacterium]
MADDPRRPHSHRIQFPEALDAFFTRVNELKLAVGPKGAPGLGQVEAMLREALAARDRGDVPRALGRVFDAMERIAELVSADDAAEGAMMRGMAAQFRQALLQGAMGDAKGTAEVMRERSGAVITPRKPT